MNFFRRVELKLNYSAAANFEKPEKVHKTRKNRPKTGGFMVVGCMAEVRVAPANTLEILHFYGIDARVYYEKQSASVSHRGGFAYLSYGTRK